MVFTPSFYVKLRRIATNTGMKPEDILNVMAVESGFKTDAHNESGNASGLTQFMPKTLKGLGFKGTHADFRDLAAEQQLDYVEAFIKNLTSINGGPLTSAAQYYVGNFVPAALRIKGVRDRDQNAIIAEEFPMRPHIPNVSIQEEKGIYAANRGLDFDKNGKITYGDIEKVLENKSRGKNYRQVIAEMERATGYKPGIEESAVALRPSYKQETSETFLGKVEELIRKFLPNLLASEKQSKKLYKQYLPTNHLVIQVKANDYTDAIEFSRVLCSALEEELLATAETHTDGHVVEVSCEINGPEQICSETVKQLTSSLQDVFKFATSKIGGINIRTNFVMNKKSVYQSLSFTAADIQYRKFLLKFV